ncbi:PREDICTED: cytochrome P450 87A3-like [Prunus mume]|uniref:Cytochrome P450 87A3-like n=1 Tax=Prunus mume TaxID=102107 RepID=A0ABM0P8R0_PRUMU|nr:PREDICTED: cytochrome P450 87A3-like [Prunus mume]
MWAVVGLSLVVLLVTYITHWIKQWRNPKCNGVLPPGSMGWPLVGETLNAMTPSYSLDLHPFVKKRLQKYGLIFRTSLVGRPIVVSADPEFNSYLFQQEGKLVELGLLDSFTKIFKFSGDVTASSIVHKYIRSITLNHFGAETLKEKLVPLIEKTVVKTLASWSSQASVEVKHASSVMLLNFGAKRMIGYDAETSSDNLSDKFSRIMDSFLSFPLNVPGTVYHNGLKESDKITTMLRDILKKRRMSPDTHRGDFLDQISSDMDKEKFLSEEFVVYVVFGILFAGFEPVSSVMALAFSLLAEHPAALKELTAENEALLKNRENPNSSLTWDEYKSMTFTRQVVNETLRLGNVVPALLRRALKDIPVKGFTIPAGSTIMALTSALQLSPNTFKDPLEFNPWRWKDLDSLVISKNFMSFGRGSRQCAGAEYTRVFLATFLHVLVTKYRWTTIKGARIARNPMLGFRDGILIKFKEKKN